MIYVGTSLTPRTICQEIDKKAQKNKFNAWLIDALLSFFE